MIPRALLPGDDRFWRAIQNDNSSPGNTLRWLGHLCNASILLRPNIHDVLGEVN